MNSAGGTGRASPRTIFPWFLAEDNPVINSGGEQPLNIVMERRMYSAGDKPPESTGENDSTLLGTLLDCTREVTPLGCLVFHRETILY